MLNSKDRLMGALSYAYVWNKKLVNKGDLDNMRYREDQLDMRTYILRYKL